MENVLFVSIIVLTIQLIETRVVSVPRPRRGQSARGQVVEDITLPSVFSYQMVETSSQSSFALSELQLTELTSEMTSEMSFELSSETSTNGVFYVQVGETSSQTPSELYAESASEKTTDQAVDLAEMDVIDDWDSVGPLETIGIAAYHPCDHGSKSPITTWYIKSKST